MKIFFSTLFLLFVSIAVSAQTLLEVPKIGPIRFEFILFALTLIGVAVFHHATMKVTLTGLAAILIFKFIFDSEFHLSDHFFGSAHHEGEWRTLLNLGGLLLGFAILAALFEETKIPQILPHYLPDDWKGGFALLFIVFIISTFLDNIAAAIIGAALAHVVYNGKVHLGFLVGIVASSNLGGSGSVLGDTTTTMMWIEGVNAIDLIHAYIAAVPAFLFLGIISSIQQDRYQKIMKDSPRGIKVDKKFLVVEIMILIGTVLANVYFDFPAAGVWAAILAGSLFVKTPWKEIPKALKGTVFLLALVLSATMMPVHDLPKPSWPTAFSLGFISSIFDNIPLTKLALVQGVNLPDSENYDWGILAYCVGFGGSMVWFGSSAGVAVSNIFPEAKSVFAWIKAGWYVIIAYVIGFAVVMMVTGWNPHHPKSRSDQYTGEQPESIIKKENL